MSLFGFLGKKHQNSVEEDVDYEDNEYEEDEAISVFDAADIWLSSGKDEDYQCGYTVEELERALR